MVARDDHNVYLLLVEDEQDNAELLRRTLRSYARLWIARTVEEARKTLANSQVHLVVADHRLPDGTGAELLRFVRKGYPHIGRVLVTAYGDSEDVVAACNEGTVERFFLKPYSPQQLRTGVLGLLWRYGTVNQPRVLVADPDPNVREMIGALLRAKYIDVVAVADGNTTIQALNTIKFDAALVDVTTSKLDGLGILRRALEIDSDLPLIFMTGVDFSAGLTLLQAGAFDLVAKPIRSEELVMRIERAVTTRLQIAENERLLKEVGASRQEGGLVAESDSMQKVVAQTRMVATHDVNVLIVGDTGTGKEVIARLLHRESRRREGPFVPVNCGAIPETLIEAELFGHERGAFTDAKETKAGFFIAADGGTIFLDEIAELSLQAQVKLLRVLETKEIHRVGAVKPIHVDVRVLAATHQDLEALVKAGKFRQDLYYRLNGFTIRIQPLRDRPADIGPLMTDAARDFCLRNGLPVPEITVGALQQAQAHDWPGNVRELLHVVERTLIIHGPSRIDLLEIADTPRPVSPTSNSIDATLPLREATQPLCEDIEKRYLAAALALCDHHLGRTAQHAGIHRKSLYNKLKQYGL